MPRALLAFLFLCSLSGGVSLAENDTLTQYSTLGTLFHGMYDGDMTLGQLASHGDFGLGTLNGLDGELAVLGGIFYQVRADGSVHVMPPDTRTPFAAVTTFAPDQSHRLLQPVDYAEFHEYVDRSIPSVNFFYAVKVEGLFARITARSVGKQTAPYPELAEVVKRQSVFEFENTRGTLVGFRVPAYAGELNVAGLHLHFLTEDKEGGGHVLDFVLAEGTVEIDRLSRLSVHLPETGTFEKLDLVPVAPSSVRGIEGPAQSAAKQ